MRAIATISPPLPCFARQGHATSWFRGPLAGRDYLHGQQFITSPLMKKSSQLKSPAVYRI
jgi:hypothetical protein